MARRSLAAGLMCALVGFAAEARGDDLTMEQCAEANENAQTLRQAGKLRAARAQLLICLAKSCAGPVRDDCGERMTEVERAAPTIIFAAKGPAGDTLRAVQITMDGARVADHLDGSALVVDPGEHVFALAADGYTSVSKKLVIREGVKGRKEVVTFQSTEPTPEPAPAPVAAPVPVAKAAETRTTESGSGQRTIAYVVGGAGIVSVGVGSVFGIYAKSTYDDATPTSNKDAHAQARVSTVAFVIGGVLLASGVVLFLTAPKVGAVAVQPSVGTSSAGIRLGASW